VDPNTQLFALFGVGVVLTLIVGFYCLLTTRNLLRALIGLEVLTKGITLLIVTVGYAAGKVGLAQSLAITLIVIEVAVIVVAVSIVLCLFKRTDNLETSSIREIKG
jgi:NADH-quinone oxidoreductase subunit K